MREIPVSGGRYVALVDDEDYETLAAYTWTLRQAKHRRTQYAGHLYDKGRKCLYMHRYVLHAPRWMQVDHIDGDGLNNQRSNLRLCTRSQNGWNVAKRRREASSQYVGVSLHCRRKKWQASIGYQGQHIHLGLYDTEIEAALAYDQAVRRLRGPYARVNIPREGEKAA